MTDKEFAVILAEAKQLRRDWENWRESGYQAKEKVMIYDWEKDPKVRFTNDAWHLGWCAAIAMVQGRLASGLDTNGLPLTPAPAPLAIETAT
jgi:hypothetical protein